ncbi:hypothetical protein HDU82_002647 [Entophlyctis luteolus]|nr:hypothetical protein HDU82_002647 [Entophlyctis luteolus]
MGVVIATKVLFHPRPEDSESLQHFQLVASRLVKSKKCVTVVGAGISVAAGIPDFRSADGLYNLVKERYPSAVVKGRDLFDAALFRDPVSTSVFYSFIAELKIKSDAAVLTRTHHFIKQLNTRGKLLRCYTQNIDCLENRLNLSITSGIKMPAPMPSSSVSNSSSASRKPKPPLPALVHLHGALDTLICTICKTTTPFANTLLSSCQAGTPPPCATCLEMAGIREALGKRSQSSGVLRPNIVLYGEHHAEGDLIAKCVAADVRKRPDVVIVMGTSLKVDGIKILVRDLARSTKQKKTNGSDAGSGLVVLFNRTRLGKEWDTVFDYQFLGDVDECVELFERELSKLELASLSGRRKNKPETGNLKITEFLKSVKDDQSNQRPQQKNQDLERAPTPSSPPKTLSRVHKNEVARVSSSTSTINNESDSDVELPFPMNLPNQSPSRFLDVLKLDGNDVEPVEFSAESVLLSPQKKYKIRAAVVSAVPV